MPKLSPKRSSTSASPLAYNGRDRSNPSITGKKNAANRANFDSGSSSQGTGLSKPGERVYAIHPYETPQWIEMEAAKVDEKYLKWAREASNLRGFHKSEPI